MKALIVDDEHLALLHFKKMLERTNAFQSIMAYQDPVEALEHPETPAVDAVFLDIEMPGVNGIELAEAIQSMNENIQVVFITAYNEFAIKAFELNAIDYLLKPVIYKRLEMLNESKRIICSDKMQKIPRRIFPSNALEACSFIKS